ASDPVVRQRHAELKLVFDSLSAAELEPAPTGLHASIMTAIRSVAPALNPTAPAPAPRAHRSPLRIARFLMPVAAGFIAGALGWAAYGGSLGPASRPADLSGAMGEVSGPIQLLSLGVIDQGVTVSAGRADKGATMLELHAADAPVHIWLASDDQGVAMTAEPASDAIAEQGTEGVLAFQLAPKALLRVRCAPLQSAQSVRVTAKLASGAVAEGSLRLEWLPWSRRNKK
ncbi:MAG: hypothetical protein ABIU54_00105, partial [Candidatus Eisenbacteria bacterium]